jgi:hypothetical protein
VTHSMALWGIIAIALAAIAGLLAGMWIGYERGLRHAEEEAEWQREDIRWKGLAEEAARPAPVRPAPPETPHAGPGKHRHPAGPRHAALPAAGYLPAEPSRWNGTIAVPAPVQQPPWDAPPPQTRPEPVLEPTAVLPPPVPDPLTDTGAFQLKLAEFQAYMDGLMKRSEADLKEITGGAR